METIVLPTVEDVAARAAAIVTEELGGAMVGDDRRSATLGLATGSSPLGLYRELAKTRQSGRLDVTGVHGFALDEYVGLPVGHPQSYREVLARDPVDLGEDLAHGVGVVLRERAGPEDLAPPEHLEQVELDVAQVALVVAHNPTVPRR